MERLTDKRMKGEGFIPVSPEEYKAFIKNEKPSGKQIYKRLLEIENILGEEYDLDRMRKLMEADRAGRCVVLPCDVGDIVYYIVLKNGGRTVESAQVDGIFIEDGKAMLDVSEGIVQFSLKEGEFFLTHAAAETALKGEQDEKNFN